MVHRDAIDVNRVELFFVDGHGIDIFLKTLFLEAKRVDFVEEFVDPDRGALRREGGQSGQGFLIDHREEEAGDEHE